jgi:hypothetical protein
MQRCSFLLALCWLMFSTTEAQFLQQGRKLVGTGTVGASYQGVSVSHSSDGNTANVAGYSNNVDETGRPIGLFRESSIYAQKNYHKFPSGDLYVRTSLLTEEWDSTNNIWVGAARVTASYDGNGNQTEWLYQTWIDSAWVNALQHTSTYDGNGNLMGTVGQLWNGSAWVNDFQFAYTYDGNGNLTGELSQNWNGSAWVNGSQSTYTYDENGNRTGWLIQRWGGSVWVNDYQYAYTYDGNGNRTGQVSQLWNGSAWVNHWHYTYTYAGSGNRTGELFQTWNGSVWVTRSQYTQTYDGNGNLTGALSQTWIDSAWVNGAQTTYTYDGNGNRIGQISQGWNGSAWVNYEQYKYDYDGNGNRTGTLRQYWIGSAWLNHYRETSTWQSLTAAVDERPNTPTRFTLSDNYPNPFNPATKISYSVPQSVHVLLVIYDMLGREVARLIQENKPPGDYTTTWNADDVPSGVYFYRLSAGDFIQTRKMVLLK